jgi:hypothetical protein
LQSTKITATQSKIMQEVTGAFPEIVVDILERGIRQVRACDHIFSYSFKFDEKALHIHVLRVNIRR